MIRFYLRLSHSTTSKHISEASPQISQQHADTSLMNSTTLLASLIAQQHLRFYLGGGGRSINTLNCCYVSFTLLFFSTPLFKMNKSKRLPVLYLGRIARMSPLRGRRRWVETVCWDSGDLLPESLKSVTSSDRVKAGLLCASAPPFQTSCTVIKERVFWEGGGELSV